MLVRCSTKLTRNATSLAKRVRSGQSLKLVLHEKLSAMEGARQAALEELEKLGEASRELTPELVEQVAEPLRVGVWGGLENGVLQIGECLDFGLMGSPS